MDVSLAVAKEGVEVRLVGDADVGDEATEARARVRRTMHAALVLAEAVELGHDLPALLRVHAHALHHQYAPARCEQREHQQDVAHALHLPAKKIK
jgi:hypothetical protein